MSFLQLVLSLDKTIKEIILLWRICQFDRYRNNLQNKLHLFSPKNAKHCAFLKDLFSSKERNKMYLVNSCFVTVWPPITQMILILQYCILFCNELLVSQGALPWRRRIQWLWVVQHHRMCARLMVLTIVRRSYAAQLKGASYLA